MTWPGKSDPCSVLPHEQQHAYNVTMLSRIFFPRTSNDGRENRPYTHHSPCACFTPQNTDLIMEGQSVLRRNKRRTHRGGKNGTNFQTWTSFLAVFSLYFYMVTSKPMVIIRNCFVTKVRLGWPGSRTRGFRTRGFRKPGSWNRGFRKP